MRDLSNERTLSEFAARLRRRAVVKRAKVTGQVGLAPSTIKNQLSALHTALTWVAAQKLIREVPAFPTIRVPKLRPRNIDEADWLKLLAAQLGKGNPSVLHRLICRPRLHPACSGLHKHGGAITSAGP